MLFRSRLDEKFRTGGVEQIQDDPKYPNPRTVLLESIHKDALCCMEYSGPTPVKAVLHSRRLAEQRNAARLAATSAAGSSLKRSAPDDDGPAAKRAREDE